MEAWSLDIPAGTFFLDFSLMGVLLFVATLLRKHVGLLQRLLIPNNLTAGLIGLALGAGGFGLLDLESNRLGAYVYHLMALLFIALGLRKPQRNIGSSSLAFGVIYIMVYLVQGIVGMVLTFALLNTVMPDLFPGLGVMLPLGFGMNPGIAYTMGKNWEPHGFEDGGIVGLSFAAMGFVFAFSIGLFLTRRYALERWGASMEGDSLVGAAATGDSGAGDPSTRGSGLLTEPDPKGAGSITSTPDVIESLTLHLSMILGSYALLYGILLGLEQLLTFAGAVKEIPTLWSFHFVLAPLVAFFVRSVVDRLNWSAMIDDVTMTRTANFFMDFMIVASIAAISVQVVMAYLVPLLLISTVVGVSSFYFIRKTVDQAFDEYRQERLISIYGNLTGTLQSGLVLLRVLDPQMKTPASYNLVYGSGVALAFGFPLLVLINIPVNYFQDLTQGYGVVLGGMVLYLAALWMFWWIRFVKGGRS